MFPSPTAKPLSRPRRLPARKRFGRPRLLIVGCGDVGLRIVARVCGRFRVIAVNSTTARSEAIRARGALPLTADLDRRATLRRLRAFGTRVVHLAPPPRSGLDDPRSRHLLAALRCVPRRFVYVSTTGVYGDQHGRQVDETTPLAPRNDRAIRRADAERACRAAGACVLRAPGIYAHERLPLERLRAGVPALVAQDDVYTNHIHADDLARLVIAALWRGRRSRVINAVDDSDMKMGDYLDLVADRMQLARPPRLPRAQLREVVSPVLYSFMSESRRIVARRRAKELRIRLQWPTVGAALDDLRSKAAR